MADSTDTSGVTEADNALVMRFCGWIDNEWMAESVAEAVAAARDEGVAEGRQEAGELLEACRRLIEPMAEAGIDSARELLDRLKEACIVEQSSVAALKQAEPSQASLIRQNMEAAGFWHEHLTDEELLSRWNRAVGNETP